MVPEEAITVTFNGGRFSTSYIVGVEDIREYPPLKSQLLHQRRSVKKRTSVIGDIQFCESVVIAEELQQDSSWDV